MADKKVNEQKIREKRVFNKKSFAFSTIALVTIVAVIVISVIFNIIFANFVPNKIDLTKNKDFSISKEAENYLKNVDEDIEIIGLFDEVKKDIGVQADYNDVYVGLYITNLMEILDQYHIINNRINIKYVDPEADPLFLGKIIGDDATEYEKGDFIVIHKYKKKRITSKELVHTTMQPDERTGQYYEIPYANNFDGAFVGAIINVTSEEEHLIGIVTDHNENKLDQYYKAMKMELESREYTLKEMKLATDDLKNYDVLMFLGSKTDLSSEEATKLSEFLQSGGNAVFLMDSIENGSEMTNFNNVLHQYNVNLINNVIKEAATNSTISDIYLYEQINSAGTHLEDLHGRYLNLPLSRGLHEVQKTTDYLKSYPFLYSSTEAKSNNYTDKLTSTGKVLLGTAVESNATNNVSKILVFGSSGFVTDSPLNKVDLNNTGMQVLTKTLSWMEGTEDFNVPVKSEQVTQLVVTESAKSMLWIIIVILVPLLIFAVGTLVWLRRRHL